MIPDRSITFMRSESEQAMTDSTVVWQVKLLTDGNSSRMMNGLAKGFVSVREVDCNTNKSSAVPDLD